MSLNIKSEVKQGSRLKWTCFLYEEQTFLSSMMQFNLTHRFLKYILRSYICHKNMVILTYFKFASGVKSDIHD